MNLPFHAAMLLRQVTRFAAAGLLLTLVACGGSGNWSSEKGYVTVGGTVSGLSGTLVLRNNGGDDLTTSSNGAFSFKLLIANGSAYAVTVATQPSGQFCTVGNGSGTATGDVSSVSVNCVSDVTIGGTITGLVGTLVLQNNGSNSLATASNGSFQFTARVKAGQPYSVSVLTHPEDQTCTVSNGSGTATATVSTVVVDCVTFALRPLPAIYGTGKAIAYGAFRAGGPGAGEVPTDAQITEDLRLMEQAGFRLIRLFGADAVSEKILRIATASNPSLKFQQGIYLQGAALPTCSDTVNNAQIAKGIELARTYTNVVTVSVGNETSFANNLPVSCLAAYIRQVRARITQPVTADDDYTFFAGRAANGSKPDTIVPLIDFVAIHTYPISNPNGWDWKQTGTAAGAARAAAMMSAALEFAKSSYNAVRDYSYVDTAGKSVTIGGTRPIVVGETGWKASRTNTSSEIEGFTARDANAKWYFDLVRGWETGGSGPKSVFYFSAFDEAWKGNDDGWGLWKADRSARYGLCGTAAGEPCNADLYVGAGYFGAPTPPSGSYSVIDFNTAGLTYTLSPFGGEQAELVTTGVPAGGPAGRVARINRAAGSQCWAGTTLSVGDQLSVGRLPFTANATTISVRIYVPVAGMSVKLKVEDASNPAVAVETDTVATAAGWQTLLFDFSRQTAGTAGLNAANRYNKISIFPNFSCASGSGPSSDEVFFVGAITFIGATAASEPPLGTSGGGGGSNGSYTVLDFNTAGVTYTLTPFGGIAAELQSNNVPAGGPGGKVASLVRPVGAECYAGVTMSTGNQFSVGAFPFSATAKTMTVRFYSSVAGASIKLKVENAGNGGISVETDRVAAAGWQTLTFDFGAQTAGTAGVNTANVYNKISIFPSFSCGGANPTSESTYHVGPITFIGANAPASPPL